MLSKEDYLGYLKEMSQVEKNMMDMYLECQQLIDQENLKKLFAQLAKEEKAHKDIIDNLAKIIKLGGK